MKKLRGVIPPAVTTFNSDETINEELFRDHLRFLLQSNIGGISIGGSTGEGHALSASELKQLLQIGKEEIKDRVPLVAGIIRDSTKDALEYAKGAEEAGADYLMITPIHYFGPNDEAHFAFFKTISDSVNLPIIIYNVVPTSVITPDCMKRLSTIDNVVGIKQSGGDIHALNKMILTLPEDQTVWSAVDELLYPTYALGAAGCIAALPTVLPELCVEQWEACERGDFERAKEIHFQMAPVWYAMDKKNMPARTKECLNQRGFNVGIPRSPLHPLDDESKKEITQALIKAKVISAEVII
ncbi:dihydrodipicolinate synthase family protein [Metabacillus arenae]|uniref:Dihydrodipicolinate synthase family protein n=1 Tax=Metabacillus arenae TaxID=2771434 RepID=A0A926NR10_9BACI|nr:dihydrodipicolinate synthase family protein [Metabacillus arenae]MBD1382422.1 dihydrodipicolinate synthase family protein [Metabacillus arenae]